MSYTGFEVGKEVECLEYNLLLTGTPLTKSKIRDLVDRSTNYEREVKESDLDSWIGTIELRSAKYSEQLYNVRDNIITPHKTWEDVPEYFLCVYFSLFGASSDLLGTKLFEKISGYALRNFIGGEVLILGFPENKNLNEYLDDISQTCDEIRGRMANRDYKDDGVDVIGYKKIDRDSRGSNLYVLQQCAAGIHWKKKKAIPIARWIQYIYWIQKNIIESISTVDFIENKDWTKHATTYGMIFDRLRIYNNLYNNPIDQPLRREVLDWCRLTLN